MEGDNRSFRVNFTSEGVSRLRAVVNEKLKEFMGDYTDDALVEYVIVLLKNGRSKHEAKIELNVFLGDDSDSFVTWLWDYLGSNLSLYVQFKELHPDGAPETKLTARDDTGKVESRQMEPEADKWQSNGSPTAGDRNEAPLLRNSVSDNVVSQDEPHRRVGRRKSSLSPRPKIYERRWQTEERQARKREVSQSSVSAPRRLLQFAVRDAIATSMPANATSESSCKRQRSVVSTSTGDLLPEERRPQRIRHTSMAAVIRAAAEAVEDISKLGPSRNLFNRLGDATDVSNTTCHQEHGHVAEAVGSRDYADGVKNFHSTYHPQKDDSILDSVFGHDGEDYDDLDDREQDVTDVSWLGTSDRNWLENSLISSYEAAANNADDGLCRPSKDLSSPALGHNASLRIASSVSMKTGKPEYHEESDVSVMDHPERALTSSVAIESDVRLMKENDDTKLTFDRCEKPATIQQHEETHIATGLQNTGPPTEDSDSRTILVSNVHFAATKDSLSRHFKTFGDVLKVIIRTDPATGQPKGSAYIEFMRKEAAELALSLDGTSFMSRLLKIVRKSSTRSETTSLTTWPLIGRPSPFPVPRFGRIPFARGIPNIYKARGPTKPGPRSFQWKRGADSAQLPHSIFPTPTTRGLTYVRTEAKTNGSS